MAASKKVVVVPASILRRILAFMIDIIILDFVVFAPFSAVIKRMVPKSNFAILTAALQSNKEAANMLFLMITFASLFALLYFALLEYRLGATIGKRILGLEVVSDTGSLKFWQVIVRTLFIIPAFPFVLFWILDPVYLAMSNASMRMLERWSMTRTIQKVLV
jgi:uncharacterized RDD family membrane protein YckC